MNDFMSTNHSVFFLVHTQLEFIILQTVKLQRLCLHFFCKCQPQEIELCDVINSKKFHVEKILKQDNWSKKGKETDPGLTLKELCSQPKHQLTVCPSMK